MVLEPSSEIYTGSVRLDWPIKSHLSGIIILASVEYKTKKRTEIRKRSGSNEVTNSVAI